MRAFVKATLAGLDYAAQHPDEAVDLYVARHPELKKDLLLAQWKAALPSMATAGTKPAGWQDVRGMERSRRLAGARQAAGRACRRGELGRRPVPAGAVSDVATSAREAAGIVVGSSGAAAVTVRDLWAGYGGRRPAAVLAGLDFSLASGERLAVVGQSGCGKSTLLHVLAGLLPALNGEALVDGRSVAAAEFEATGRPGCRSGHAAYMFQRDLLLPWKTVLGNAMFAAGVAPGGGVRGRRRSGRGSDGRASLEASARAILGEFGLGDALDVLPAQLSGGMRQRVALARTLVLGRGLVLLDEPLGSLDALTRAEMQGWLLDVMEAHPATWVLVTHDVREALLLGDRVAVLAGRPARLEGWLQVPFSASERRASPASRPATCGVRRWRGCLAGRARLRVRRARSGRRRRDHVRAGGAGARHVAGEEEGVRPAEGRRDGPRRAARSGRERSCRGVATYAGGACRPARAWTGAPAAPGWARSAPIDGFRGRGVALGDPSGVRHSPAAAILFRMR